MVNIENLDNLYLIPSTLSGSKRCFKFVMDSDTYDQDL